MYCLIVSRSNAPAIAPTFVLWTVLHQQIGVSRAHAHREKLHTDMFGTVEEVAPSGYPPAGIPDVAEGMDVKQVVAEVLLGGCTL